MKLTLLKPLLDFSKPGGHMLFVPTVNETCRLMVGTKSMCPPGLEKSKRGFNRVSFIYGGLLGGESTLRVIAGILFYSDPNYSLAKSIESDPLIPDFSKAIKS